MHFVWFRSTSLRVWKFLQIKGGGSNFWRQPILQNVWIIWSSLSNSISILKVFYTQIFRDSLDFSRFCMNQEDFSQSPEIKEGRTNFWEAPILQNVWIIWSTLLYFNFKIFFDPNSSPFIRFQWILCDSRVLLSGFQNLYKFKRGDLISEGNQFAEYLSYLVPPLVFESQKCYGRKFSVIH